MKTFLTIDEKSRLKLSDLDNKNNKPVIFDINSDYDKSVGSFSLAGVARWSCALELRESENPQHCVPIGWHASLGST